MPDQYKTTEDAIIEARDLNVKFEMDRGESHVIRDVSIDIKREEILGIVGESGSGKSMFASALLDAVVDPGQTSGDITYYPKDKEPVDILELDSKELRKLRWDNISMVFQGAMDSFNPTLTIRGHFKETLDAHGVNKEEGLEHARELLADLYLNPDRILDSYPHQLSGGMSQRALIALSLVLDPEILVMDEPTAALDLLMQRSIIRLLDELQEKYDLTVVFITHDLPLVAGIADRLAVLYAFEFVEIGTATEVIESSAHPYSRSLLKAVPNLDAPLEEMNPIEGTSPDPINVPSGCSYHPRCSLADDTCRDIDPDFYTVTDSHEAACHHWEKIDEAISLDTNLTDSREVASE